MPKETEAMINMITAPTTCDKSIRNIQPSVLRRQTSAYDCTGWVIRSMHTVHTALIVRHYCVCRRSGEGFAVLSGYRQECA